MLLAARHPWQRILRGNIYTWDNDFHDTYPVSISSRNGDLTLIGRIDVKSDPNCLFMDRTGRYLLSSYYRGEGLHVHAVSEDGALREEAVA